MRLRVILLVLAIGSLILVSFMLPLALLLRTFAVDNALSGATIRAQLVAPLVATLHHTSDLQVAVDQVNEQNPSEPVTIFMPSGQRIGAPGAASHTASGWPRRQARAIPRRHRAESRSSWPSPASARTREPPSSGPSFPTRSCRHGVVQAWLLLGLVAVGLLAMAVIVAAQLSQEPGPPAGQRGQRRRAAGPGRPDRARARRGAARDPPGEQRPQPAGRPDRRAAGPRAGDAGRPVAPAAHAADGAADRRRVAQRRRGGDDPGHRRRRRADSHGQRDHRRGQAAGR